MMEANNGNGTISPDMLQRGKLPTVEEEEGSLVERHHGRDIAVEEEEEGKEEEKMKVDGASSVGDVSVEGAHKSSSSVAGPSLPKKAAAPRTQSCDSCRSKKVKSLET